jgi:hypothetical protein
MAVAGFLMAPKPYVGNGGIDITASPEAPRHGLCTNEQGVRVSSGRIVKARRSRATRGLDEIAIAPKESRHFRSGFLLCAALLISIANPVKDADAKSRAGRLSTAVEAPRSIPDPLPRNHIPPASEALPGHITDSSAGGSVPPFNPQRIEPVEIFRAVPDNSPTYRHKVGPHPSGPKLVGVFEDLPPQTARSLRDYVAERPELSRLQIESWRTKNPPSLREVYELLSVSQRRLPGSRVELAIFLDPVSFHGARQTILATWEGRPLTEVGNKHFDMNAYLEGQKGKTLLMVGHIENAHFVKRDPHGYLQASYSVPWLVERARFHDVLLIPVGCQSARAGAAVGFIKNISTDDVSATLRSLPRENPTVGDLLVSLRQASEIEINFPGSRNVFELAVMSEASGLATIRMQIPRTLATLPGSTGQANVSHQGQLASQLNAAEQFDSFLVDIESRGPWWARGAIGAAGL